MVKLNGSIFDYTDKYFILHPEHTRKELYELQDDIRAIIRKGSSDIERDLHSDIASFDINYILKKCNDRGLVKKVKTGNEWVVEKEWMKNKKISVYRYFT